MTDRPGEPQVIEIPGMGSAPLRLRRVIEIEGRTFHFKTYTMTNTTLEVVYSTEDESAEYRGIPPGAMV